MMYSPGVFIASSTSPADVIPVYRDHAKNAVLSVRMNPIMYEYQQGHYPGLSPVELSQQMIDKSDLFVGIYTGVYGERKADGKSWAEYEYDYAVEQQKERILFISKQRPADDEFRVFHDNKLKKQHYRTFTDAANLQTLLEPMLASRYEKLVAGRIVTVPVFGSPARHSQYEADIFMIMPFRPTLTAVYQHSIKPVVEQAGLSIKRGDNFFNQRSIMTDIWSATYHAKAVIADCTGQNANVFYELGIAHTLGRDFILLTQDEKDIPFDLRHYRYFVYQPDKSDALRDYLLDAFEQMNI